MRPVVNRLVLAALLLMLPLSAQAANLHWTAVGSTGTVDPSSNGYTYTGAGITYSFSGTFSIQARYNVVNPTGTETPAWTTLEMGYTDPASGGGSVLAQLIQVDPCTGATSTICTVSSVNATQSCRSCTFSASTINFSTKLYFVQVILNRSNTNQFPTLYTLRIF